MKAQIVKRKQRGGFVVGLIIGLLLGLALALGVALYVTKAPMPFINKVPQRTADRTRPRPSKNRNWDPNAPLDGKNPAQAPRAPRVRRARPRRRPAGAGRAAPPTPVAAGTRRRGGRAGRPPAAAGRRRRPPPRGLAGRLAAAAAGRGSDPFFYFVQAGAFRTPKTPSSSAPSCR